eukprot:gene57216-biopygen35336
MCGSSGLLARSQIVKRSPADGVADVDATYEEMVRLSGGAGIDHRLTAKLVEGPDATVASPRRARPIISDARSMAASRARSVASAAGGKVSAPLSRGPDSTPGDSALDAPLDVGPGSARDAASTKRPPSQQGSPRPSQLAAHESPRPHSTAVDMPDVFGRMDADDGGVKEQRERGQPLLDEQTTAGAQSGAVNRSQITTLSQVLRREEANYEQRQQQPQDVTVQLERLPDERWLPWGLKFSKRMLLQACSVGCIAARSPQTRMCVGMRLHAASDVAVHCPEDFWRISDERTMIALLFRSLSDAGDLQRQWEDTPREEDCEATFLCFLEQHSLDMWKGVLRETGVCSKPALVACAAAGDLPQCMPQAVRRKIIFLLGKLGKQRMAKEMPASDAAPGTSSTELSTFNVQRMDHGKVGSIKRQTSSKLSALMRQLRRLTPEVASFRPLVEDDGIRQPCQDDLLRISYSSIAAHEWSSAELAQLGDQSRCRNAADGVSGPPKAINALESRLRADHRHYAFTVCEREDSKDRLFDGWDLEVVCAEGNSTAEQLAQQMIASFATPSGAAVERMRDLSKRFSCHKDALGEHKRGNGKEGESEQQTMFTFANEDIMDGFEQMSKDAETGRPKRPVVPDDAALTAMGFGELTALAMRCKLPGGCLRDESSTREGLRRFREENAEWQRGADAVDVAEQRQRALPSCVDRNLLLITLTRDFLSAAASISWGMVFDAVTLRLTQWEKGSIASGSAQLRGCAGMKICS